MSEGEGPEPIARWRVIACFVLVAQVVLLLALKSALEEESWFVGTLSATVEEGPLMLEGVAANITIDMQNDQDDVSIEFFGPLRLTHWQDERDSKAELSQQEVQEYDENLNETFPGPSPSTVKSTTFTLIHLGIGFSIVLFFFVGLDLKKQSSKRLLTVLRRFTSFASILNTLLIVLLVLLILPVSWFGTVAGNPQDFSNSDENVAFLAHADFSGETSIGLDGFELEFEASGYDIGMVRPANRSAGEAQPPLPGSTDAASFILISGEMRTETPAFLSEFVYFWIVVWVLIPFALLIQQRVAIDSRLASMKLYG
ncbi:MAG: hypothetical protein MKZ54_07785 [Candidatus Poseidoniaceae archaeon]|nr:hypothetical protein [Candidatus Poseidoniaceae archaeon]